MGKQFTFIWLSGIIHLNSEEQRADMIETPDSNKHRVKLTLPELIPQPNFPEVDLLDSNAEALKLTLGSDAGVSGHGVTLQEYQHKIYEVSTWAMDEIGIRMDRTKDEYRSFAEGFAAFEAIASIVKSKHERTSRFIIGTTYDNLWARRRVRSLFLGYYGSNPYDKMDPDLFIPDAGTTAKVLQKQMDTKIQAGNPDVVEELGVMYSSWQRQRPNTHDVILDTAPDDAELNELYARIIGARVAYALQIA